MFKINFHRSSAYLSSRWSNSAGAVHQQFSFSRSPFCHSLSLWFCSWGRRVGGKDTVLIWTTLWVFNTKSWHIYVCTWGRIYQNGVFITVKELGFFLCGGLAHILCAILMVALKGNRWEGSYSYDQNTMKNSITAYVSVCMKNLITASLKFNHASLTLWRINFRWLEYWMEYCTW